ncbi:MAG: Bug family tripartite tricarboxylate transporter substrate binding protein [Acidimicrobiia bacterium]
MNRRGFLRTTIAAATAAGLAGARSAQAQAFPSKPIKVVVPATAGGASDIVARIFQKVIAKSSPHPLVIQNMPGGGTSIGGREVAGAAPDGHTVLMMHEALIVATTQGIFTPGIDALAPIAMTGRDVYTVAVNASGPFRTLKDLFDAAKGGATVRTAVNIGGLNHLTSLIAAEPAKATLRPVQHGGGADSNRSLLGNQVDVIFSVPSDIIDYHKAGQMRILGVMADSRSPFLPDVPTTAEAGFPSKSELNHMWWMPKATPPDRIAWFRSQLEAAMKDDEVKTLFTTRTLEQVFQSGAALEAHIARKKQEIGELVERFGLKQ